ncbi:phosphonate transport system permease protein [Gemmobacter megaterium]|uniref:Phosphonate transport system permease protein n=1 Tax=Gemmobacter megaterium TaxID=1086013 RepID=A0A1N7NXP7_9RHOB|nr:phosphonate ABC transporter, permease protein PhnE [Gemmobacter megaterium]GGE16023.1 phosphonate ABC transporter, permease protein PhnE [Gemmobacter megaterium]SIT03009.1 phosphonate transport system permease protein [Gemmobacter megaterium]
MSTATLSPMQTETVTALFARRRLLSFAVPAAILAYLLYAAVAFDLAGLAARARMDNAAILLSDFLSHKTHVTRDNRSGALSVSIEGDTKAVYPADRLPGWITASGDVTTVDLGGGHLVTYDTQGARYVVPGYGTVDIRPADTELHLTAPLPLPDWINASANRVTVTTDAGRFTYTRSKVEVFRYSPGWEMFFFTLDSPFHYMTWGELAGAALWGERVRADMPNIAAMAQDFWTNRVWRHGDVAWAMSETVLMAFLGTFGAALVALPLGFLAARNMNPLAPVRFGLRRVFDFIRGVDGLIWTIILARAFGPGPMTGSLAILLTDTGSFGKMFSEALENIDEKQVEGVRSTGADTLQRARFGVLPQVMPVLLSQVLYFLESNTRGATVIGAIVGGGIGLLLTQAIQTQKEWEDVAYYMVLIVLTVMAMDSLSGWLRRKLIKGE